MQNFDVEVDPLNIEINLKNFAQMFSTIKGKN